MKKFLCIGIVLFLLNCKIRYHQNSQEVVYYPSKEIFEEAGFRLRQPGCSACLAMNDDKIPAGEYCVSTSNRNFEGRQGPGARTILASPLTAAAAAIAGKLVDHTTMN